MFRYNVRSSVIVLAGTIRFPKRPINPRTAAPAGGFCFATWLDRAPCLERLAPWDDPVVGRGDQGGPEGCWSETI